VTRCLGFVPKEELSNLMKKAEIKIQKLKEEKNRCEINLTKLKGRIDDQSGKFDSLKETNRYFYRFTSALPF